MNGMNGVNVNNVMSATHVPHFEGFRVCRECRRTLPLGEFYSRGLSDYPHLTQTVCKLCDNAARVERQDEMRSSAIVGRCSTCGRKGMKVSSPPLCRCIDRGNCERTRLRNAKPNHVHEGTVMVCVVRRGAEYYFRRETPKFGRPYLELVPEKKLGTRFGAVEANRLIDSYGGKAVES